MLCKKCGGNLVYIEDTIVQCENCLAKFRVKARQNVVPEQSSTFTPPANEEEKREERIEIDHTRPFSSSRTEQAMIEKELMELTGDELNRTLDDDIKTKLVAEGEKELGYEDVQNRQDVNDAIREYEEETYPEMRPIMEKIYCSKCSKPVDLKTGICPSCQNVMPLPERQVITCPYCQYENNNIKSEFCINCGKDLDIERDRLGIVLQPRPKAQPVPTAKKKKSTDDDDKNNAQMGMGKIVVTVVTIIMLIAQGILFFVYNFISNGSLVILNGGELLDYSRLTKADALQDKVKSFGVLEESKFFEILAQENNIVTKILGIIILVFILSIVIYAITSMYGILIKKNPSKVAKSVALINFFTSIILLGFAEFMSYIVLNTLTFGTFSALILPIISFLVTFISFVIL